MRNLSNRNNKPISSHKSFMDWDCDPGRQALGPDLYSVVILTEQSGRSKGREVTMCVIAREGEHLTDRIDRFI